MKLEKLVGERFKERPSDCVIDSHALMQRGGYMKYVGSGIYSLLTPLKRVSRKIEQILREEMEAIDGQEVQFPVAMPASLWEESGRYEAVGSELLRFKDRYDSPMVLGMTHEEASVQLAREYGNSYTKYPFMIYQIQTKFRDEARPRAGLIRVREFTMKDGYSFHTSQEDLEKYYARCYHAYERIFARVGVPEVISVASDAGMMGGNLSHEYMLLTPIGEDTIVTCKSCDYRVNMEAAENITELKAKTASSALELVSTPRVHTIEELCNFVKTTSDCLCKAVVYRKSSDNGLVILFIRGDLEANETKLTNYLGGEISPATITEVDITAGFIGPCGLGSNHTLLFDSSLKGLNNLYCGGNKTDYHYSGLDMERDCKDAEYHDFGKITEGGICPKCRTKSIEISRGIEVGNIFQLGNKYSKAMDMKYQDKDGDSHYPVMGCYGIGVGRLAASVCEARHDEYGPIWPITIAPWQVHICALRSDDEKVRAFADDLYEKLQTMGIEVIYDDRSVTAGVMFSDADLLGVPVRVVVSPRNLGEDCCELVTRDKSYNAKVPMGEIVIGITDLIDKLTTDINQKAN